MKARSKSILKSLLQLATILFFILFALDAAQNKNSRQEKNVSTTHLTEIESTTSFN